jgi:hypothetical protein
MRRTKFVIVLVVLLALLALPATALAAKRLYTARLSSDAELHEVVGANASGAFQLATAADGSGYNFRLRVRNLSGAPMAAHLHGPADENNNAPVVVTLCSGNCPFDAGTGIMDLEGVITGPMVVGMTGAAFQDNLEAGLIYVNVHTALNPAGEARGQVTRANP